MLVVLLSYGSVGIQMRKHENADNMLLKGYISWRM